MLALILAVIPLVSCPLLSLCVRSMWRPRSFAVALGDLDGDGDLDAYVANGHTDDKGEDNAVWLNDGEGQFTDSGQRLGHGIYSSNDSRALALADVDSDGDLDAYVANLNSPNAVWLNDGRGRYTSSGQLLIRQQGTNTDPALHSVAVSMGDLDGDGDLDAFVGNCCRTGEAWMIDNQGVKRPLYVRVEPFDTVWLNDGGIFSDSGQFLGATETRAVALGDLDGDDDLDTFVGNKGEPNRIWLNDGAGTLTDSGQMLGSADTHAVALGDVDGDGDLDAYSGNDGPNAVWLNDGAGTFTDSGLSLGDAHTLVVHLVDLDGDGDLDALAGDRAGAVIWLNEGRGLYLDSGQRLRYSDRYVVTVGDVDGDGDLDVLAASYERGVRMWRNDGLGRFD
jgi:hypothetical protein